MKQLAHTQKPNNDNNKQKQAATADRQTTVQLQAGVPDLPENRALSTRLQKQGTRSFSISQCTLRETVDNREPRVPQGYQTVPEQSTTSLPGHTSDQTESPN